MSDVDFERYKRIRDEKMRQIWGRITAVSECGLWTGHANAGPWSKWTPETWMPNGSMGDREFTGREERQRLCLDCGAVAEVERRGAWAPPSGTPDVR
jgi:hypothetical protein